MTIGQHLAAYLFNRQYVLIEYSSTQAILPVYGETRKPYVLPNPKNPKFKLYLYPDGNFEFPRPALCWYPLTKSMIEIFRGAPY